MREKIKALGLFVAASIGVKEDGMKRADLLSDAGVDILTIDIAHGDSVMMFETLAYVKKKFPEIDVIAGNTATPEGVRRLIEHGADSVKVDIVPLTAVAMCVLEAQKHNIPVIADGGIKTSG